jgi:parvulin-like peptidyl-prolyl isomerase
VAVNFLNIVKLFPLLGSFLVFTLIAFAQEPQVLDGMAAEVNEEVITFSQVRELTTVLENQINANYSGGERTEKIKEVRLRAVNDLIDRQLIIQEFRKLKASIPSHVVDDRINAVVREEFGGDRSAFLRTIAAQGYSIDRIRKMEEEKVIVQAMRQREVKGDPIIPAGRVESYYRQHAQEWTQGDEVKLKMIKFVSDGAAGKKLKMLQEIREKIVRGADFGDMARIYSEDNTQDNNGDWGWVKRGDLSGELERAVFALAPGKVSDVVSIGSNYYLLLAEAKKGGVTKPLSEIRGEIERRLTQEERQKMQQGWLAKLRKKAYIKIY